MTRPPQSPAASAYKQLAGAKSNDPSLTLVFCWSHVRRGFYDLAKTKSPIAVEALRRIGELYEIEQRVRGKRKHPPGTAALTGADLCEAQAA